ncbi:hypothetical protein GCM10019016_087450 [Streptomyces prasinosporus]|uniref:Uncharacterized protein n=1 Tax=Streptomyces prasinosporus TaxID=68256 RepID=A0ABP6U3X0_9ACTN
MRAALRRGPAVLSTTGRSGRAAEHVRVSHQYVGLPGDVLDDARTLTRAPG